MDEGAPNQESVVPSFDAVVAALRMKSPEAVELVTIWTIAQEKEVDAAPTPAERSQRMVQFEILRARMYIEIDDREGGMQALRDAWEIAARESLLDLLDEIETRMNNLV